MINSLFVNASILITFLYLSSQIFKHRVPSSAAELRYKVFAGLLFGICGCILMFNGVVLVDNMIMDFRLIALIISAIYCGPVSTLITAIFIVTFRIGYFGLNSASLVASANLLFLSVLFLLISKLKIAFTKKYILMCLANILSSIILTLIRVKETEIIISILLNYILSTTIVSFVIYFVLLFIFRTNELYSKLRNESSRDYLTGLYNVREFDMQLNKSIAAALDNNDKLSVLMIDLDNFKHVNDSYGHASGDMILKQFSDILISSCRSGDIIARKGGEEFSVILLDCDNKHAKEIAERIRLNVEKHNFITDKNESIRISVSIGVGSFPEITNQIENLLSDADKSLYYAKQNGKNQVQ